MLTNVTEGGLRTVRHNKNKNNKNLVFIKTKCHQYWPDLYQTINYGSYQIISIDEQNCSAYKKRVFQLSQVSLMKRLSKSSIVRG